jgi:hypothetical protein
LITQTPTKSAPTRWTSAEISQLIAMRRKGMSFPNIATALNKTERAVSQKYQKLLPASNSPKRKTEETAMSEEMKIRLLSAVARGKDAFWVAVAKEVGEGATGTQCEATWNMTIRERK